MANTTNLNLVKPAGTDKALVSVLNSNSDKIDAWAGTTNQALSNLDTPTATSDILASALQTTKAKLFRGSGSSYTGTLPDNSFKWGTFSVEPYDNGRTVWALSDGHAAINYYNGSAWTGWKELALKSDLKTKTFSVTTQSGGMVDLNSQNLGYNRTQCIILAVATDISTGDTVFADIGIYRASTTSWTVRFTQGSSPLAAGVTFNLTVWYCLL